MMSLEKRSLTFNNLSVFCICLTLAYSWFSPHHYQPWDYAFSNFSSFLSFIILCALFLKNYSKIIIPKILLFIPCISIIPLLQTVIFPYMFFGDALINAIYLLSFFLTITISFSLTKFDTNNSKKIISLFSWVFIIGGILSVYFSMIQWLGITANAYILNMPEHNRPSANFGQPNVFAFFLVVSLLCVFLLFETRKINTSVSTVLALFFLFGIALTQSRMSWVCILFLACFFSIKIKLVVDQFRFRIKHTFFLLIAFVFFIWSLPEITNHILGNNYTVESAVERASGGQPRISMWKMIIQSITMQPLFGYGWGQVNYAQVTATPFVSHYEWAQNSHNIILDLLVWNGIPMGCIIVVFSVRVLWLILMKANDVISSIASAMVFCFCIYAMLELPYNDAFLLLPIGFMIGVILSKTLNDDGFFSVLISGQFKLVYMCFIIIIFLLTFIDYIKIDNNYRLFRVESNGMGTIRISKQVPSIYLLNHQRKQLELLRKYPYQKMTKEELMWMKNIAHKYPSNKAIKTYAKALAYNNFYKDAVAELYYLKKTFNEDLSYTELLP